MHRKEERFLRAVSAAVHELLMEKGRVVLPGWGALMAHARPAYYDRLRALFHPPGHRFSFNPLITADDGELFALLHRQWGWTLHQITEQWQALTEAWESALGETGRFELPGVGAFIRQGDRVIFRSAPEAAYRPETWLLPVVKMPALQERRWPTRAGGAERPGLIDGWKVAAVWVLVLIGAAVLWQLPPRYSEPAARAEVGWYAPTPRPASSASDPQAAPTQPAAGAADETAHAPKKAYYIIIGSYQKAAPARRHVRQLQRNGIQAQILHEGQRYRVAAVKTRSLSAAEQLIPFIRRQTGRPDAWIYETAE